MVRLAGNVVVAWYEIIVVAAPAVLNRGIPARLLRISLDCAGRLDESAAVAVREMVKFAVVVAPKNRIGTGNQ